MRYETDSTSLSHTLSLSLSLFLSHITHTHTHSLSLTLSLSLSLGSVSSALDEASFICIIFCSSESMHNSEVGTANYNKWLWFTQWSSSIRVIEGAESITLVKCLLYKDLKCPCYI